MDRPRTCPTRNKRLPRHPVRSPMRPTTRWHNQNPFTSSRTRETGPGNRDHPWRTRSTGTGLVRTRLCIAAQREPTDAAAPVRSHHYHVVAAASLRSRSLPTRAHSPSGAGSSRHALQLPRNSPRLNRHRSRTHAQNRSRHHADDRCDFSQCREIIDDSQEKQSGFLVDRERDGFAQAALEAALPSTATRILLNMAASIIPRPKPTWRAVHARAGAPRDGGRSHETASLHAGCEARAPAPRYG